MPSDHACHVQPLRKDVPDGVLDGTRLARLRIWGMNCENCAHRVRNGLLRLEGVWQVDLELRSGMALVRYDPQALTADDLVETVWSVGPSVGHVYGATLLA